MRYQTYKPSLELAPYIEFYWTLRLEKDIGCFLDDICLPDSSPEWIFNVGEQKSFITLNYKANSMIVSGASPRLMAIRFKPSGLANLANINMRKCKGAAQIVSPGKLFPFLKNRLEDAIFNAGPEAEKIAVIERNLESRLPACSEVDHIVSRAVGDISQANGNIAIDGLAQLYNLSRVALGNRMIDNVGLSPKELARIYRFNYFVRIGLRQNDKNLAELALESGYYDQSHLNRDFKSITGITPSSFFRHASSVVIK